MQYRSENHKTHFVVGISIRTSNEENRFQHDAPPLWERFFLENLIQKIPHRIHQNLMAVYTDYESDYTKPFTYIIGCEVSAIQVIPDGMVGIEIPPSHYSLFTVTGEFPQSLVRTWDAIWKSDVRRSYTTDFEMYPSEFPSRKNPEVTVYIATDTQ